MNGILSKSDNNCGLRGLLSPKPVESVETAGSLASNHFYSLFETNNAYDMFTTSNPFAVDYSMYADYGDSDSYGGFLASFSNAVSVIGGFSDGAGFSGGGCASFSGGGGFSGGGCSSGGFTSFC